MTVRKICQNEIASLSVQILGCLKQPKKVEKLCHYGNTTITKLAEDIKLLLAKNSNDIKSIPAEWQILKNKFLPILQLFSKYLDVWSQVFNTDKIKV